MSWNIRSMSRNSDDLKTLITCHNPIAALQEIMTVPNLNSSPFNNYTWHFFQTPTNMHPSVGISIQKHIPSNPINISTNIPAIAVKISSPIESTIVSLYLSPSLHPSIFAQEMETLLPQLPSPAIILGDFNARQSTWENPGPNTRGHMLQNYFDTSSIVVIHNTTATRTCPTS